MFWNPFSSDRNILTYRLHLGWKGSPNDFSGPLHQGTQPCRRLCHPHLSCTQSSSQCRRAMSKPSKAILKAPHSVGSEAQTDKVTRPCSIADWSFAFPAPYDRSQGSERPDQGTKVQSVQFMIVREGEAMSKIPSKAFAEFPQFFSGSQNANIARMVRYWCERHVLVQRYEAFGKLNNDIYMYFRAPSVCSSGSRRRGPTAGVSAVTGPWSCTRIWALSLSVYDDAA